MKQNKKAFTLIEMIFVVVVSSILSMGTFKAFEALYIRSAKAKSVTNLSIQSQIVLDQISALLYNRIPNSVIGYDGKDTTTCTPIEDIVTSDNSKVLEWLSLDNSNLIAQNYSGFVDMNASSKPDLKALDVNKSEVNNRDLIFAGSFDSGSEDILTCKGAYGWHGNDSDLSFKIKSITDNKITLDEAPEYIYEKYYLTNGAYAVARGADIDKDASCITDLAQDVDDNTLFLFYEFYPYKNVGDTYCADKSGTQTGKVAILAKDVASFGAVYENDIIHLRIDINKPIKGSTPVHITKQKAVF